jgi:hypothetical protein
MSRDTNVTDRWVGHYILHGEQWPNAAELVQTGERLTGSMTDGVTDKDCSVTEVAREAGLPPGGDE